MKRNTLNQSLLELILVLAITACGNNAKMYSTNDSVKLAETEIQPSKIESPVTANKPEPKGVTSQTETKDKIDPGPTPTPVADTTAPVPSCTGLAVDNGSGGEKNALYGTNFNLYFDVQVRFMGMPVEITERTNDALRFTTPTNWNGATYVFLFVNGQYVCTAGLYTHTGP